MIVTVVATSTILSQKVWIRLHSRPTVFFMLLLLLLLLRHGHATLNLSLETF